MMEVTSRERDPQEKLHCLLFLIIFEYFRKIQIKTVYIVVAYLQELMRFS